MGTWAYSYNFASAVALGDHVRNVIEMEQNYWLWCYIESYNKFTPEQDGMEVIMLM